jgi:hypothetical protein
MAAITIACPSCGAKTPLGEDQMGRKLQCPCGMAFSASPVFAVPNGSGKLSGLIGTLSGRQPKPPQAAAPPAPPARRSGPLAVSVILLGASAGVAAWLMTRPSAAPPPPADEPATAVAEAALPAPAASFTDEPQTPPAQPAAKEPEAPKAEPPGAPPMPPPAPPPAAVGPAVRAVKLWDAFDLDPGQARTLYAGHTVTVTARGRLLRDAEGRPYFGAELIKPGTKKGRLTPREQRWEREGYPPNVLCYLAPDQAAALEGVPPEREVVLRGTCVGRRDEPNVYRGYVVVLEDCRVVAPTR